MKTRNEIDDKYKIDLTDLFENDKEFKEELEKLDKDIEKISEYENHLLDSADKLLEFMILTDNLELRVEKINLYSHINNDCDLENKTYNELYGLANKLYTKYSSLSAFIWPEFLRHDYSVVDEFIKENNELKKYERCIKEIYRMKEHMLSKEENLIITNLYETIDVAENVYSKLTDVDLKFGNVKLQNGEEIELSESNWGTLIESKNREDRKNVFKKFFDGYKSIINSTAELMSGKVKTNNALARIYKYDNALEKALHMNDIDIKVYNTLIESINENLDILHRQWKIRKDILGVDELHLYDTYVPLVKDYEKKYTYEDAQKVILDTVSILGEDYKNTLKRFFDEKWIDVFPNKNKRGGAYCTCFYKTHPYVLTNFDSKYDDVSTIIHEFGHGMHYYYAQKNQTYVDYNYSIFVAEVASQVNEILLALNILNKTEDKNEKIFILDVLMKHFKASVARQAMFAEFEKNMHDKDSNGEILTYQTLCDDYYELNKKYFGNDIVVDDEIKYEWSRIPHFYYNFYVYQYSTGYIAALKIASDIYNKKDGALDKYLEFLKLGCTKDPVESLKVAGVDLTNKETFNDAFKEFNREMDEFESLIKEV